MTMPVSRPLAATIAITMLLSGCATTGGTASAPRDQCSPWKTGAAGALVGALAGATKNSDAALKGAVIGAAVGALACVAINASSRQTRTADAVQDSYRRDNAGRLPEAPAVVSYDTAINPGQTVSAGQQIDITSRLAIVDGSSQKVSSVREELVLLDTAGKEIRRVGKDVSNSLGGEYENKFSFSFPKGVSQGVYGVRTELLVNGRIVGRNAEKVQLVLVPQTSSYQIAAR